MKTTTKIKIGENTLAKLEGKATTEVEGEEV